MADKENQSRGLFKRKPKDPAKPGRIEQMREVFKLARKHYPALPWILLAAVVGITLVGVLVGFLLPPVWLWGILGFMGGVVFALWILRIHICRHLYLRMAYCCQDKQCYYDCIFSHRLLFENSSISIFT